MVKHTQTIRRQFADKLFECVWPFCSVGAQRVNPYVSAFYVKVHILKETCSYHLQSFLSMCGL